MKIRFVHFFVFIVLMLGALVCEAEKNGEVSAHPLLVVVLMIKNEASVICQTLQPFVDAGVDSFFIFDTGSTDGTQEVVADYFKRNKIKEGHLVEEPFVDFSTSRNRALELAEQQFPHAHFMIMLDAEWYLQNTALLLQFCRDYKDEVLYPAYLIRVNTSILDFFLPRLVRPQARLRFVGAVHEYLDISHAQKIPSEIYFEVRQAPLGIEATRKRLIRDLEILTREHARDPQNTRAIFFLGQTNISLGNLLEAYRFFRLCVKSIVIDKKTPHWKIEQSYQSSYNSAVIASEMSKTMEEFNWKIAFDHYIEAFLKCPQRAEPLICIAQYYWEQGNFPLCFIFARRAAEFPFPASATGLVEKDVYSFTRYELLAASAGNIGEWDISEWATRKAIEFNPDKEYLYKNLEIILNHKMSAAARQSVMNKATHYEI